MNLKNRTSLVTLLSLILLAATPALGVPGSPGDFDGDGDVDVYDFFNWQLGESPNPLHPSDLADWEFNFGTNVFDPTSITTDLGTPNGEVSLSLNLFPNDFSDPSAGGNWDLVAKTTSTFGISAIAAVLNNVSNGPSDITLASNLGAINPIDGADPYLPVGSGPVTQLLYGQNISDIGVVVGVGLPSFSSAVPADPLGDSSWNDATTIASGTYGAILPSFGDFNNSGDVSQANVLDSGVSPFFAARANGVSLAVRIAVPEPSSYVLAIGTLLSICISRRIHRRPHKSTVS
jgi:hypothetical protein